MNKKALSLVLALASVALLVACGGGEEPAPSADAPASAAAPAAAPAGNATITGTVTYANGDPDTAIRMDADPICKGLHSGDTYTEKVVAQDGRLANVFVYVKEGLSGKHQAPAEAHVLDQKGCQYSPHVSGVMVGQKLVVRNSDPTLHNVHALPTANPEFNQGQPFQGMELEKTFQNPEVMVRFKCDVHPWMSSYMGVLNHPFFAVSGADGSFELKGLPAGSYVLEAWHEEFGTKTANVTVEADGTAEATFDFSPAA